MKYKFNKKIIIPLLIPLTGILLIPIIFYLSIKPYTYNDSLSGDSIDKEGHLDLVDDKWIAGSENNSIVLTYTVGESGITEGGAVKISLGHVIKMKEKRRIYIPFDLSLVANIFFDINPYRNSRVRTSNKNVDLSLHIPSKIELLGKYLGASKYKRSTSGIKRDNPLQSIDRETGLTIKLKRGSLSVGDEIYITIGNKENKQGISAPHRETMFEVIGRTDGNGDGHFDLVNKIPKLNVIIPEARRFNVVSKFNPDVEESTELLVVAQDDSYIPNRILEYDGTISFAADQSVIGLPPSYTFTKEDKGIKRFPISFSKKGLFKIKVFDNKGVTGMSHYIDTRGIGKKIFFGDLHVHSIFSYDAGREPSFVFERQRDIDGYDFTSLTDHDMIGTTPLGADRNSILGTEEFEWNYIRELGASFNQPGKFITLNGFEWTNYKDGHRNVHYRGETGNQKVLPSNHNEYNNTEKLIENLSGSDVLVIPHSTGWKTGNMKYDWGPIEKQRLVEIYSTHGSSEFFDNHLAVDKGQKEIPSDSWLVKKLLMYDIEQATKESGNFVQDGLASGRRFGFIGSGDIHYLAYIDQAYKTGIAAVFSPKLEQNEIYNGLYERETYGTTGARIGIRFSCNGFPMGSEIKMEEENYPHFSGEILGTDFIKTVELIKYDGEKYIDIPLYKTIDGGDKPLDIFHFDYVGDKYIRGSFYYLRVIQIDGNMGWASPIWLD